MPKMNVVDPTNPGALFENMSADKILVILNPRPYTENMSADKILVILNPRP
jgi:hypothetical protein